MVARWAQLGREAGPEGLDDGKLQWRQQPDPPADIGPRQPHLPLRRAGAIPKGHGRARRYVRTQFHCNTALIKLDIL